jgi:hypothetical protein
MFALAVLINVEVQAEFPERRAFFVGLREFQGGIGVLFAFPFEIDPGIVD